MAWLSVYESVDGPKLRALYKELNCSKFEALGILNFLWFWGLHNANEDGMVLSAETEDISRYLYGVGAGCKIDGDTITKALIATGWINIGENGHLYLHDWGGWQEQRYKAIKRRASDTQRKREERKVKSEQEHDLYCVDESQEEYAEEQLTLMPDDTEEPEEESKSRYTKPFEEFWSFYPRKVEKGNAYKKYRARLNDGYSEEELLQAVKAYAEECRANNTEMKFIKHAKTFLSDSLPFTEYLSKTASVAEQEERESNPFSKYCDDDE